MSVLRSSLFVAFVSLLVLLGYGSDVFDNCCDHETQVQVVHGKARPVDQNSTHDSGCQCLCHQLVPPLTIEPVRLVDAGITLSESVACTDEFPPDAVPVGIDYPPQLA